jgi:hypothetical protein
MAKGVCCHVDTCVYNHDCNCEAKEITVCNCKCHEAKDIQETACETLNVNRKFNMTSQKVRSNFCDVFCYKYELYKKTFICFIFCIHIKT